jgi:hypothetical protein
MIVIQTRILQPEGSALPRPSTRPLPSRVCVCQLFTVVPSRRLAGSAWANWSRPLVRLTSKTFNGQPVNSLGESRMVRLRRAPQIYTLEKAFL